MNPEHESSQKAVDDISLECDVEKHQASLEKGDEDNDNGHQAVTVAEKDGTRNLSPLPFPEHIIQVVMDIIQAEKEEELKRLEAESTQGESEDEEKHEDEDKASSFDDG